MTGDEETAAYSDNESDSDGQAVRHERKGMVQLINGKNAEMESIWSKIVKRWGSAVRVGGDVVTRGKARVGKEITGVETFDQPQFDEIRKSDRFVKTELKHGTALLESPGGALHKNVRTVASYSILPMIERYIEVTKWRRDMLWGVVIMAIACTLLYYIWFRAQPYL